MLIKDSEAKETPKPLFRILKSQFPSRKAVSDSQWVIACEIEVEGAEDKKGEEGAVKATPDLFWVLKKEFRK